MSLVNSKPDWTERASKILDKLTGRVAPHSKWVSTVGALISFESDESSGGRSLMLHCYVFGTELYNILLDQEGIDSPYFWVDREVLGIVNSFPLRAIIMKLLKILVPRFSIPSSSKVHRPPAHTTYDRSSSKLNKDNSHAKKSFGSRSTSDRPMRTMGEGRVSQTID
ncbi:hypothetical protein TanjilG_07757 [Lupinus angustifolius]|uniref:Uncharacterized protein n=1 Tax=Lupinus angustifolius TaxID=3871 RepID=A0A1J7GMA2_LUPAN|nr:hypothetical protein TanjilG_07757 [Lupinus angustifolius]